MKDLTPEEKLLNLIKKKKEPGGAKTEAKGAGLPKAAGTSKIKRVRLHPAFLSVARMTEAAGLERLLFFNAILAAMVIIVVLYFLIDIFLIPPREFVFQGAEGAAKKPGAPAEKFEPKPYEYYSEALGKDAFKPAENEEPAKPMQDASLEDVIGDLVLLGIVAGESPQAIIEDKKQQKSYFIKEGQTIAGIMLKKIDDGSVTVVYKNEEFSLTL